MRLVVASNNTEKRREITEILRIPGLTIVPPEETVFVNVEENASSFAENARKKAEAFASANACSALGDDSGLVVYALHGAPGVHSSRYAGKNADDSANNARLLAEMQGMDDRRARFVCAVHLTFTGHRAAITAEGHVDGWILEDARGTSGFGYDPLFFCPELNKTFGQATATEKASVSHRGRALRLLAEKLAHIEHEGHREERG